MVSKQEVKLLEETIKNEPFCTSVQIFREICDVSSISFDHEKRIVNVFIELCKKAKTEQDTQTLSSAIFNLKLAESLNKFKILAALMATANVRTPNGKYGENNFYVSMRGISVATYTVVSAKAIENVYNWGWTPTSSLSWNVSHWIDRGVNFRFLPEKIQQYVMCWIDRMKEDCITVAEHPIKRQQRLLGSSLLQSPTSLTEEEIKLLSELIRHEC